MEDTKKHDKISIYRVGNGRVGIAIDLGKDENGKRIRPSATAKTEEEAKRKLYHKLQVMGKLPAPEIIVSEYSPIRSMVEEFKRNYIVENVAATGRRKPRSSRTNDNYLYMLAHFEEHFSNQIVKDIDVNAINRFYDSLVAENKEDGTPKYSQATLKRIEYVVTTMFRRAKRKGFIAVDPTDNERIRHPQSRQKQEDVPPYTKEEIGEILDILRNDPMLYTPILLLATTGMRCEELLALKWENIDFENEMVLITGAITTETDFDNKGKRVGTRTILAETKTAGSVRGVQLKEETKIALLKWKSICETSNQKGNQTRTGLEDYVFGTPTAPSWTYDIFRRTINGRMKAKGHECVRFHRIRHYVGTTMAAAGAEAINIMTQLGHKKLETTRRYIGLTDKALVRANGSYLMENFTK